MIDAWLDLPVWLMFLTLAIGFGVTAAAIYSFAFSPWTRAGALSLGGIVPTYFSAVSVLLALLTGFVANDTWERQRQAGRVLQSESDNVLAVYDLSVAAAPDMSAIRTALSAYAAAVVTDEWPQMANAKSSPKAAEALGALLREVAAPKIAADAGAPTQSAILASVLKIRSDRSERLALNEHLTDSSKWLALMILGLLTQIAIGLVHLERPRAHLATLLIFTTALVSALGLIAEHEWPFDGPAALQPHALQRARERIAGEVRPATLPASNADAPKTQD